MSQIVSPPAASVGTVNTTDATVTTLCTFDISTFTPLDCPILLQVSALARITSGGSAGSCGMASAVRGAKFVSGTVSAVTGLLAFGALGGVIVANVMPLLGDAALLTATVTVDFSTTTARLRVAGIAATNITWTGAFWPMIGAF